MARARSIPTRLRKNFTSRLPRQVPTPSMSIRWPATSRGGCLHRQCLFVGRQPRLFAGRLGSRRRRDQRACQCSSRHLRGEGQRRGRRRGHYCQGHQALISHRELFHTQSPTVRLRRGASFFPPRHAMPRRWHAAPPRLPSCPVVCGIRPFLCSLPSAAYYYSAHCTNGACRAYTCRITGKR